MPAPTPPAKRAAYQAMRRVGSTCSEAARVAGISRRTASRLEARHTGGWHCPLCSAVLDGRKDAS